MTRQQQKSSSAISNERKSKGRTRKNTTTSSKRKPSSNDVENSENEEPQLKKQKWKTSALQEFDGLTSGVVLTLGEGNFGQLGLGEDVMTRKKPALVGRELTGKNIKKIVAGGMHTVCLTDDHKVYTFGCNDEGSLGRETSSDDTLEFEPHEVGGLLTGKQVIDITAGDSHSAALTDDGEVFVWGCFRDNHGKLGLVKEWQGAITPVEIPTMGVSIMKISSGNDHIAMITASGQVLTMGCGEQGQLGRVSRYFLNRGGRRNAESCLKPKPVQMPKVKGRRGKPMFCDVYCGSYFTFVVSTVGDVFAFGLNNYNQLGLPDADCKYMPVHIPVLSERKWKSISGGQHHCLLLSEQGEVYTIGRGEYGRLGLGEDVTQADVPTKVEGLKNIVQVDAGSCVSFAVNAQGKAYGWGMGTNLQLTTGEEEDEWSPVVLTGKNLEQRSILMADGGGQHTVLLACDKSTNSDGNTST